MAFTKEQEKQALVALLAVLVLALLYQFLTAEKPKTAPLTYTQGAVATSPVRKGLSPRTGGADPLNVFLERREEKYPGVSRDLFRMEALESSSKKPKPMIIVAPTPTVPAVPVKTPEQIAEELARADLSKFRFLGYLTDKDNTLFLSKDGENFLVKSGDRVLRNYRVKEAGKDHVVLFDTITRVEVRVELSGSEAAPPSPMRPR